MKNYKLQSMKKILVMLILIGFMFFLCLNLVSAAGWTSNLDVDLLAYWNCDDSSGDLIDSLGTANATTKINTPLSVAGVVNNATYSTNDDYWIIANKSVGTGFNYTASNFTLSFWVNSTTINKYYMNVIFPVNILYMWDNPTFKTQVIVTGYDWNFTVNPSQAYLITLVRNQSTLTMDLYVNGVYNGTHDSPVGTDLQYYFNSNEGFALLGSNGLRGWLDEIGMWNRTLTASEISDLYNSGSGITYGVAERAAEIKLISPADESSFSIDEINFTTNYSVSVIYNLTNVTYYIWNSTGGIFNNSVVVDITGISNETTEPITEFSLGDYEWNVLACYENATFSNCSFADANYSFNVGAELTSISYNNQTYETASETFTVSFNILEDSEIALFQLVYNGTNYTISNLTTTATTLTASRTIDILLNANNFVNETKDFFFRFTYAGNQIQETETYSQNISFIHFQLCNATYTTTALNFTYYDEITNSVIDPAANATSIQTTFNYWIGSGNIYKNYSYNNLTNNAASQYKFCISPSDQTFIVNTDLNYEAEAYSPRTYYLRNASITNQTNEIALNLLTISDSVKFFITVNEGMTPFPIAIVTISKYFTGEGVYRTTSIRETDEVGEFIEYLDLDKKYRYSIVRDGVSYGTIIKQASCEEAPCEITLQLEEAVVDMWQGYYDTYAKNVAYTLFYNDTNKIVTYTFNDLTGLAQYFRLLVTQISSNQTGATICDESLYSTAGTLTCNMTGYGGDFRATGYIHRSPGRVVDFILFVLSSIKDTLGAMGILVSLFIIITVALVGSWNPAVGVILVAFSVFMMKILGFVAFGYTTVILIFILAVILAVKMKT